jgi:endonuclease III
MLQRYRKVKHIDFLVKELRKYTKDLPIPAALFIISSLGKNPFLILISCILSLRTKDTVSLPASMRLFEHARTPQEMLMLPLPLLEELIYPVGFYRRKSLQIKEICTDLINKYNSKVPSHKKDLLSLKGVGIKTTNLVLGLGFSIPALCVDIHVHRISNTIGLVSTKTAEATEVALQIVIPKEYWIEYNTLLVMWGQNSCSSNVIKCKGCILQSICLKNKNNNFI